MDDTAGQLMFGVLMAAALAAIWLGLEKAAGRWKWFRIAGIAVLLLIFAVIAIMAVRLLGE